MSKTLPASLESSEDSRGVAFHETVAVGKVAKRRGGIEHFAHVMCIVLPIGSQTQHTACDQYACEQLGELGLNQATLVMPFLRPRIRKEHMNSIDAGGRDATL